MDKSKRRETRVRVDLKGSLHNIPTDANDIVPFWEKIVAHIPEKFRSKGKVEISPYYDAYDVLRDEIRVWYYRPENEEEHAQRTMAALQAADVERRYELNLLAKLKAKYEYEGV